MLGRPWHERCDAAQAVIATAIAQTHGVPDVLATKTGHRAWSQSRIESRHTHGTGCTLASAIAAGLAQGLAIEASVDRAREYVRRAIAAAPGIGRGHGPLDHAHPLRVSEQAANG